MSCKNCGSNTLENQNFCPHCGAKIIKQRLQAFVLIKDWLEKIFNVDNKFFATFFHLSSKPESVIIGYIDGLRKRYMAPINYLLLVFGLYGFYLLTTEESGYFHEELMEGFFQGVNDHDEIPLEKKKLLALLNFPLLIFQIPLFAIITKCIYRKSYNYAEHLIIATYWLSHVIFITFITSVLLFELGILKEEGISIIGIFMVFLYTFYIHRSTYKQPLFKQLLKFVGFLLLSFVLLTIYFGSVGYLILG